MFTLIKSLQVIRSANWQVQIVTAMMYVLPAQVHVCESHQMLTGTIWGHHEYKLVPAEGLSVIPRRNFHSNVQNVCREVTVCVLVIQDHDFISQLAFRSSPGFCSARASGPS